MEQTAMKSADKPSSEMELQIEEFEVLELARGAACGCSCTSSSNGCGCSTTPCPPGTAGAGLTSRWCDHVCGKWQNHHLVAGCAINCQYAYCMCPGGC